MFPVGGFAKLHMGSSLVDKEGDRANRDRAFVFFFSLFLICLGWE
jgi:hypothetical protein